jgi:hypothetical protein
MNASDSIKTIEPEMKKQALLLDINVTSLHIKHTADLEKSHAPPLIVCEATPNISNNEPTKETVMRTKEKTDEKERTDNASKQRHASAVETGIVGAGIQSKRSSFLERITHKVLAARTKAEQLTGCKRNLRGIELFRSKVRLVILLMKIAPSRSSTELNFQHAHRPSVTDNAFDLFDFDETKYDFDSLNKKQQSDVVKAPRFDSEAVKELGHRIELKLVKRVFDAFLNWKNKLVTGRNEMKAKATKADIAYLRSLMRRSFHKYQQRVLQLLNEKLVSEESTREMLDETVTPETIPEPEIDLIESTFGIGRTPSFEMKQLSLEDSQSRMFRENCSSRFGIDPSPLGVHLAGRTRLKDITQMEYTKFFAHGIELRPGQNNSHPYFQAGSIELFDRETLRQLKHQKRKAASGTVNIFDVPADVLASSCAAENDEYNYIEYRLREKVNCLTDMGN